MRTSGFLASMAKEARLLTRDLHGLALLFLMPTIFILVMSLALQDVFAARTGDRKPSNPVSVSILDLDRTDASRELVRRLTVNKAFAIAESQAQQAAHFESVRSGDVSFGLVIPAGYGAQLETSATPAGLMQSSEANRPPGVDILVAPETDKRTEIIFASAVRGALGRQRIDTAMARFRPPQEGTAPPKDEPADIDPVTVTYAYDAANKDVSPSAVQQNVPAWLVFSIFFVAIPFSQTFIRERDLGTQRRLKTTNLSAASQVFGKLIPYFAVNQVQVVLMFCIGIFVVPLLGGDALRLRGEPAALVLMSAAISFAALGLALLIATLARTSEQASMLSALGNIVLGAFGGIMVPRFVMPEAMQSLSAYSPMAWGLDGYLRLLLYGGGVGDIIPEVVKLLLLGAAALSIALLVHRRQE